MTAQTAAPKASGVSALLASLANIPPPSATSAKVDFRMVILQALSAHSPKTETLLGKEKLSTAAADTEQKNPSATQSTALDSTTASLMLALLVQPLRSLPRPEALKVSFSTEPLVDSAFPGTRATTQSPPETRAAKSTDAEKAPLLGAREQRPEDPASKPSPISGSAPKTSPLIGSVVKSLSLSDPDVKTTESSKQATKSPLPGDVEVKNLFVDKGSSKTTSPREPATKPHSQSQYVVKSPALSDAARKTQPPTGASIDHIDVQPWKPSSARATAPDQTAAFQAAPTTAQSAPETKAAKTTEWEKLPHLQAQKQTPADSANKAQTPIGSSNAIATEPQKKPSTSQAIGPETEAAKSTGMENSPLLKMEEQAPEDLADDTSLISESAINPLSFMELAFDSRAPSDPVTKTPPSIGAPIVKASEQVETPSPAQTTTPEAKVASLRLAMLVPPLPSPAKPEAHQVSGINNPMVASAAPVASATAKSTAEINAAKTPEAAQEQPPKDPAHETSAPATKAPPLIGTSIANVSERMNLSPKSNEIAEPIEQNLPLEAISSISSASAGSSTTDHGTKLPLPFSWREAPSESVQIITLPTKTAAFDMQGADIAADAPVRSASTVPLSSLEQMVSRESVTLRQTGADTLGVALRLDSNTQLFLQLTTHNGLTQASVRLDRGQFSPEAGQWAQLQQSLAKQNIELLPMTGGAGLNFEQPSNGRSRQSFARQDWPTATVSAMPQPVQQRQQKQQNRPRKNWETWA